MDLSVDTVVHKTGSNHYIWRRGYDAYTAVQKTGINRYIWKGGYDADTAVHKTGINRYIGKRGYDADTAVHRTGIKRYIGNRGYRYAYRGFSWTRCKIPLWTAVYRGYRIDTALLFDETVVFVKSFLRGYN